MDSVFILSEIYSKNKLIGQRAYDALYVVLHAVEVDDKNVEEYLAKFSSLPDGMIAEGNSRQMTISFCCLFLSHTHSVTFDCLLIDVVGNPPSDEELKSFNEQVKSMIDLWMSLYKNRKTILSATRCFGESVATLMEVNYNFKTPKVEESSVADADTADQKRSTEE